VKPVEPSSYSLTSLVVAPVHLTINLLRFAYLCVKYLFDAAYKFFFTPSEDRDFTVVIDSNAIATNQEQQKEVCDEKKRQWDLAMGQNITGGVSSQKEFDLIKMGQKVSIDEQFLVKRILQIQGFTSDLEEAKLHLIIRLPENQIDRFPLDILEKFDQKKALELYIVFYDVSNFEGNTFDLSYHFDNDTEEKEIYTGIFESENIQPLSQSQLTFGQFSPSKVPIRAGKRSNLQFNLDKPIGSFFTAAQDEQKEMGIFGIVVRDWNNEEAQKIIAAGTKNNLRLFLQDLEDLNFVYFSKLKSLLTYNKEYYFRDTK